MENQYALLNRCRPKILPYFLLVMFAVIAGILLSIQAYEILLFLGTVFYVVVLLSAPKMNSSPIKLLNLSLVLFLLVLVVWPNYGFYKFGVLPGISPTRIMFALLVFYWLYSISGSTQFRINFVRRLKQNKGVVFLIVGLMLWKLGSVITSETFFFSLYGFLNETISYVFIFFLVLSIIQTSKDVDSIILWFALSAFLIGLLGLYEAYVKHNLFIGYIPVSSEYLEQVMSEKLRGGKYRTQATFDHPLLLAEYIVFILPILVFAAIKSKGVAKSALFLSNIILLIVVMYETGTRSGVVSLAIVLCAIFFVFTVRKIRLPSSSLVAFIGILSFGLIIIVIPAITYFLYEFIVGGAFGDVGNVSANARLVMWEKGYPLIVKEPFFGYGVKNAAHVLGFVASEGRISIDSYYLSLVLDSGVPALVAFVLLLSYFVFKGLRCSLTNRSDAALLAGMFSISVLGMLVMKLILSLSQNLPLLYLACAMILVLSELSNSEKIESVKE